jgi:hypothetical protein
VDAIQEVAEIINKVYTKQREKTMDIVLLLIAAVLFVGTIAFFSTMTALTPVHAIGVWFIFMFIMAALFMTIDLLRK